MSQALSQNDHMKLRLAKWLIRSVVKDHPLEVTARVALHMYEATHGIDLIEKELDQ